MLVTRPVLGSQAELPLRSVDQRWSGYTPKAPGPRERHLLLALLFIGIVIFRMAQLVLIVDLELLGGFHVLVDLAHGCLIFTGMFIVSVIVVILRAGRRVL